MKNVFGTRGVRAAEWTLHELVANHSAFDLAKLGAMIAQLPLAKLTLPYYAAGAVVTGGGVLRQAVEDAGGEPVAGGEHVHGDVSADLVLPRAGASVCAAGGAGMGGDAGGEGGRAGARAEATMLLFVPLFAAFTLLTFPAVFLFCGLVQALVLVVIFFCARWSFRFEPGEGGCGDS